MLKSLISRSASSRSGSRALGRVAQDRKPFLNLAEQVFRGVFEEIGERIVRHCERPDIELRILAFLTRALGPSTEGIASEMGISPEAAAVHLELLHGGNRIWGQPVRGHQMAWHISQDGRRFLEEHVDESIRA